MNNPRHNDAVLRNQALKTPYNAVVLSGIEGAKQRLNSTSLVVKLEALVSALKYDEEGLKLVHQFIAQETDASMKWIYSNWLWLQAKEVTRVELTNSITCLKYISQELMELIFAAMIADSSDSKVMPTQTLLNEIENTHSTNDSYINLPIKYQELADLYCLQIKQGQYKHENYKIAMIAYTEAIAYSQNPFRYPNILNKGRNARSFELRNKYHHPNSYRTIVMPNYSSCISHSYLQ